MTWSKAAWAQSEDIYNEIIRMPFINGLIDGTLDQQKFKFYISQDANYLEQFGRALSLIAARTHRKEHVLDFIRFAEGAIVVESALHGVYFKELGINDKSSLSPACHHYTSFLTSTAALAQVEVAMGAVLPCFWIYKEAGDYIYQHQNKNANPYQNWINTYAGEEFGNIVKKAIHICDEVAAVCTPAQQQAMTEAFITASRMEWLFWDSAWRLEKWPV